jgi:signal transduction histidine kinase
VTDSSLTNSIWLHSYNYFSYTWKLPPSQLRGSAVFRAHSWGKRKPQPHLVINGGGATAPFLLNSLWSVKHELLIGCLAVLGALCLLLCYLAQNLRASRARNQADQIATRADIAANLHDELGSQLMRIHLQAESLLGQPGGHAGLPELLVSIQGATSALRDVAWGLDASADNVNALQDRMREQLDQLGPSSSLAITFTTEGLEGTEAMPPPLRQEVYLVFKEAVTNAMRHAPGATGLVVRLCRESDSLVLEVLDDGLAVKPGRRHSMGLRNMAKRARELGGELSVGPRTDGVGFRVWLSVPLVGEVVPSWFSRLAKPPQMGKRVLVAAGRKVPGPRGATLPQGLNNAP